LHRRDHRDRHDLRCELLRDVMDDLRDVMDDLRDVMDDLRDVKLKVVLLMGDQNWMDVKLVDLNPDDVDLRFDRSFTLSHRGNDYSLKKQRNKKGR
jgi:hypothetical protein